MLFFTIIDRFKKQPEKTIAILTWGGLRGGLAIALALSLPENAIRDILVNITYGVVIFSVLVQGSSLQYVLAKPQKKPA